MTARPRGSAGLRTALCFLGGAGFSVCVFGRTAIDPSAVQWLLAGDPGQSFLGWHMARREMATFPLGRIPSYVHPIGGSLAYADAMPWFSALLLLLSPHLGEVFQHAGLWLALSYGLLAALSFRLLRLLTRDDGGSAVATAIVVVNPVLLFRRFHLSLCAHWLVVAALLVYFRRASRTPDREPRLCAGLVLAIAAGTHPYLAAMVLGVLCAAAWVGRRSVASAGIEVLGLAAVAAASLYAFGYLSGAELGAAGFGTYSANLLTFLDADHWSRWMPDLPRGEGQYEGFGYLGLAAILLLVVVGCAGAWRRLRGGPALRRSPSRFRRGPLLAVVGGFAVYALGSHPRVGSVEIVDLGRWYAALEPLPSAFRSSGRFVWPAYYLILFSILAGLRASVSRTATYSALCLLALAVQVVDAWPRYSTQDVAFVALASKARPLASSGWLVARGDYDEIRLLPPAVVDTGCDGGVYESTRDRYMPFALLAGILGMRINSGHLSRYPPDVDAVCRDQMRALAEGRLDPRVVYAVAPSLYDATPVLHSPAASCGRLDGERVCVAASPITAFRNRLLGSP